MEYTYTVFHDFITTPSKYESRNRRLKNDANSEVHILSTIGEMPSSPLEVWKL